MTRFLKAGIVGLLAALILPAARAGAQQHAGGRGNPAVNPRAATPRAGARKKAARAMRPFTPLEQDNSTLGRMMRHEFNRQRRAKGLPPRPSGPASRTPTPKAKTRGGAR